MQVGVGEVAVEGARQGAHHLGVGAGGLPLGELVERAAVGAHDRPHVVGGLHAPLDLKGAAAGADEGFKVADGAVVARREQARAADARDFGPRLVVHAVGQAARLAAEPAVRRAAALGAAQQAFARIADAQRAVAEHLELDALVGAGLDLAERELARKRDPRAAAAFGEAHAARVVHVRLGGEVKLEVGPQLVHQAQQPPVLDDEGVGPASRAVVDEPQGVGELVLADEYVDGHVDARTGEVGHPACRGERLPVEVVGVAAGVEGPHPAVDGVGAGGDGGLEGVERPGRREQFGEGCALGAAGRVVWHGVVSFASSSRRSVVRPRVPATGAPPGDAGRRWYQEAVKLSRTRRGFLGYHCLLSRSRPPRRCRKVPTCP